MNRFASFRKMQGIESGLGGWQKDVDGLLEGDPVENIPRREDCLYPLGEEKRGASQGGREGLVRRGYGGCLGEEKTYSS